MRKRSLRIADVAGANAAGERLSLDENPHPAGSAEHHAWAQAYERTLREDQENDAFVERVLREERQRDRRRTKAQKAANSGTSGEGEGNEG